MQHITVTWMQQDGTSTTHQVECGTSLMNAAVQHGVAGIIGQCGGGLMCATCHVYVDPSNNPVLAAPDELEQDMLEIASHPQESSRLSCQIIAQPELDGLVVTVPTTDI